MEAIETGKRLYEQFGYLVLIKTAYNSPTRNLTVHLKDSRIESCFLAVNTASLH